MSKFYTIYKFIKPSNSKIIISFTLTFLLATFGVVMAFLIEGVINEITNNLDNFNNTIFISLAVIFIVNFAIDYGYLYIKSTTQKTTEFMLQSKYINKFVKSNTLDRVENSEYLTNLMSDIDEISRFHSNLMSFGFIIFKFSWSLAYGLSRSIPLTLVIILCSFASVIVPKIYGEIIAKMQHLKQASDEDVKSDILQIIDNVELIKSFNSSKTLIDNFKLSYLKFNKNVIDMKKQDAKMMSLNYGIGFLVNTIWIIVGLFFVMNDNITIGVFAALMSLSPSFNAVFHNVPYLYNNYIRQCASYERISSYLEWEDEVEDDKVEIHINKLQLENICFSYNNEDIIKNFSYQFKDRKKYLIKGRSGTGKSTLLYLITGLYQAKSGNIKLNDKSIDFDQIANYIGLVDDNMGLFTGSLKSNLTIGCEDATQDVIDRAIKFSCLQNVVESLPKGLNTEVGNKSEISFSKGEMQRILLARAIIRDFDIIVLDELTAALDEVTEKTILENLTQLDKIIIMTSHKSENENFVDEVIDLDACYV